MTGIRRAIGRAIGRTLGRAIYRIKGRQAGRAYSRNARYLKIIVLMLAITILPISITASSSYFSDTETVQAGFTSGAWAPAVSISKACPNWGVTGTCRWAVFIYGKGFLGGGQVYLIKGERTLQSLKNLVISDSIILALFDLRGAQTGSYNVKVILGNGTEGILKSGFKVIGDYFGCPFPFQKYCSLGDGLCIERKFDSGNPNLLLVSLLSGCPGKPDYAYLIGSGGLIKGKNMKGKGVSLTFELPARRSSCYDLLLEYGEINLYFENAVTLPSPSSRLELTSIDPSMAVAGKAANINVYGSNLSDKTQLWLEAGARIDGTAVRMVDAGHLLCTFDLTGAAEGTYSLGAMDANGTSASLPGCFAVKKGNAGKEPADNTESDDKENNEAPKADNGTNAKVSFYPRTGAFGSTVTIIVTGRSFAGMVQSRLSNQKAFASSIACEVTSNGLSCTFNLTGIPPGTYTLEIMDKYGNIVYRAGQFEVI